MRYVQRQWLQLLIGLAAVLVSVAALVVIVDRVADDDDDRVLRFGAGAVDLEALGEIEDLGALREALEEAGLDLDLLDALGPGLRALASRFGGPVLGVTVEQIDGALVVQQVAAGSPAERAGLAPGDELRSVGGEPVATVEELRDRLDAIAPGERYEVEARRDGDPLTLDVERAELAVVAAGVLRELLGDLDFDFNGALRPGRAEEEAARARPLPGRAPALPPASPPVSPPVLPPDGARLGVAVVDAADGLRVASVAAGSGAEAAGLRPGDVIASVAGVPVGAVEELQSVIEGHAPGDEVAVIVQRDGAREVMTVTLTPAVAGGGLPRALTPPSRPQLPQGLPEGERAGAPGELLPRLLNDEQFIERLLDRLRDALRAEDAVPAVPSVSRDAPPPAADATVYFGRVSAIHADALTLTGSLGDVTLGLTPDTRVVGPVELRTGGLVTVVAEGFTAVVVAVIE